MRDQDEIYEAATETPASLGCPSLVPGTVVVHDEPGVDNDELQRKGEKLKACNDRSYAKMVRISELANECVLKTTHAEYAPGQYGQDYRVFGKTMGEIRELVGKSIADVAPDYEMLARELTRDGFDADRLAKAIEAEASKRPIDYPTFYTPGWLAEIAKAEKENEQPEMRPVRPQTLDDIGMNMDKRVSYGENGEIVRIDFAGIRHLNGMKPFQLWEINVSKHDTGNDGTGSHITVYRDHEIIFSGTAFFGLSQAADVAISMMIRKIIGDTAKKYRDRFRRIRKNTAMTKAAKGGEE